MVLKALSEKLHYGLMNPFEINTARQLRDLPRYDKRSWGNYLMQNRNCVEKRIVSK